MKRRSAIRAGFLIVSLCGTMWAIPPLIESLEEAPSTLGEAGLPEGIDAFTAGGEAPDAPTMSQWLAQRTADTRDAADLRIIGAADPNMTEAQRLALLEEAQENAPKVSENPR
jgi:hypothetical protein